MEMPEKTYFLDKYDVVEPMAFKTACSFLGMNKYSSCVLASGILYYFSWKTMASSDNDDGDG